METKEKERIDLLADPVDALLDVLEAKIERLERLMTEHLAVCPHRTQAPPP